MTIMKKPGIKMLLFAMAVILYGCPNNEGPYEMYTKIKADGSCYREFIRNADSSFVAGDTSKNPFPMKLDSSWKITFYKRMADDTTRFKKYPAGTTYKQQNTEYSIFAIAKKEYPSVESLSKSFRYDHSAWDSIIPMINFEKKFRWFYTYYEFNETYTPINPFKMVPVSNYLSNEEIAALYGEDRDLYKGKNGFEIKTLLEDLEHKSEAWFNKSCYEETYRIYLKHFRQLKNMPVDSASFAMAKDSIFKYYGNNDSKNLNIFSDDFNKVLDKYFNTKAFTMNQSKEFEKEVENEFPDFLNSSNVELNYRISLPGQIIETNAPIFNNDTLSWKVENDRFYFNDYKLSAVSRKPNYWAFCVTGFIVVLSVLVFWVKRK
jgi:hypothetical protein